MSQDPRKPVIPPKPKTLKLKNGFHQIADDCAQSESIESESVKDIRDRLERALARKECGQTPTLSGAGARRTCSTVDEPAGLPPRPSLPARNNIWSGSLGRHTSPAIRDRLVALQAQQKSLQEELPCKEVEPKARVSQEVTADRTSSSSRLSQTVFDTVRGKVSSTSSSGNSSTFYSDEVTKPSQTIQMPSTSAVLNLLRPKPARCSRISRRHSIAVVEQPILKLHPLRRTHSARLDACTTRSGRGRSASSYITSSLYDSTFYSPSDDSNERNDVISPDEKLRRLLVELIDDEERYVTQLHAVVEILPALVEKCCKITGKQIDERGVVSKLRKHLSPLFSLHSEIHVNMGKAFISWNVDDPAVLLVLHRYIPLLKMVKQFLNDKAGIVEDLVLQNKSSAEFSDVLRNFEKAHVPSGVGLAFSLDIVHQRICRYQLYLERYDRQLAESSPVKETLHDTLAFLLSVLSDINTGVADGAKVAALHQVQNELHEFNVFAPGRVLLKKGDMEKYSRKELQPRRLYLFNDALLVCKAGYWGHSTPGYDTPNYKVLYFIPMKDIVRVGESQYADMPCDFMIYSLKRSMIFLACSVSDKISWLEALTGAIDTYRNNQNTYYLCLSRDRDSAIGPPPQSNPTTSIRHRALSRSTTEEHEAEPEADANDHVDSPSNRHAKPSLVPDTTVPQLNGPGSVAPVWVPDERCSHCSVCQHRFTPIVRRHHCRVCGSIVCTGCSAKAPIPHAHYSRNIACIHCYDELLEFAQTDQSPAALTLRMHSGSFKDATLRQKRKGSGPTIIPPTANSANDCGLLVQGYICHRSDLGAHYKKYWGKLYDDFRLELYKAPNDTKFKIRIPILGFTFKQIHVMSSPPQTRTHFELHHENATVIVGGKSSSHFFCVENEATSQNWIENVKRLVDQSINDLTAG